MQLSNSEERGRVAKEAKCSHWVECSFLMDVDDVVREVHVEIMRGGDYSIFFFKAQIIVS